MSKSEYLPFTKPNVSEDFNKRYINKDSYKALLVGMQGFIDNYFGAEICSGKNVQLVKELLELIKLDQSIKDTDVLYVNQNGQPVLKSELNGLYENNLPAIQIFLPAFLLGIWHFIVVMRPDNSIGEKTYNRLHNDDGVYNGNIGLKVVRQIELIELMPSQKGTNDNKSLFQNESEPKRISDIFILDFQSFDIQGFIDTDPIESLTPDRIRDAISFIGRIRCNQEREDILDKNEDIYQSISTFIDTLCDYLKRLKSSAESPDTFPECFEPLEGDFEEFTEETNRYRQELNSLYQTIKAMIENETNNYLEQMRASHREIWGKNIQSGIM